MKRCGPAWNSRFGGRQYPEPFQSWLLSYHPIHVIFLGFPGESVSPSNEFSNLGNPLASAEVFLNPQEFRNQSYITPLT
jgi:hypothetical protein